jgi:hypothetical protein
VSFFGRGDAVRCFARRFYKQSFFRAPTGGGGGPGLVSSIEERSDVFQFSKPPQPVLHHLTAKPFLKKEGLENDIGIAQWISKALGPLSRLCDKIAIRSTMRGLVNPLQPKQALQRTKMPRFMKSSNANDLGCYEEVRNS